QHADAIMQVLSHLFEPSPSPHPALDFFDQTGVAEFPARRLFRLFYRLTALYSVAHGHFKMRSDLLFELPFLSSAPPKWDPNPFGLLSFRATHLAMRQVDPPSSPAMPEPNMRPTQRKSVTMRPSPGSADQLDSHRRAGSPLDGS